MIKKTALTGLIALAFLSVGCSKQEAPPSADRDDDEEVTTTAPAPAAATEQPPQDYPKMAQGMMGLLAQDKPECQRFHDEMQAIIDAPPGSVPPRDPAHVVAEAHDAGCSTKSAR
jgi:PBP1b-binding outer membrane lipoprotein LpoB